MLRLIFLTTTLTLCAVAATALPNGYVWGCLPNNVSASLPFCDNSLPVANRVTDLLSRLSVDEMLGMIGADTVFDAIPNVRNRFLFIKFITEE
jgi:hypothetical protein